MASHLISIRHKEQSKLPKWVKRPHFFLALSQLKLGSFSQEEQMDADEILPATTEEREEEPDPHSISDQNPVQSTSQEQGGSNKENEGNKDEDGDWELEEEEEEEEEEEAIISIDDIDKVKLLYKGHQILNVIFGILSASLAVLRWNKGRVEFNGATILIQVLKKGKKRILICLVDFSVHMLVWVLPQSMISRNYADLETKTYMRTAAMVLDVYAALLMVNIQYIIVGIIPFMIFLFIGELAWKRKSRETAGASQYNSSEEVLSAKNQSSGKLVCFAVISYLLQLSLVTWTQYKGQQGCTPILSDFLLFLASALGALRVMLASPLAGVGSRVVSTQVLPVLHKTCTVLLLVAVHTLAAEWLGEDMIYVCLPELIVVLVWFTICFGQPMSDSSSMSPKSQVIISSVVATLAYLTSWQANDWNMHVSWIILVFWISLSSSALSGFHAWLLLGWPGSTTESKKLIHLLKVASTVGSSAAVILCVSLVFTDPSNLHESVSSFEHKTIATVLAVFCSYLLYSYAASRHGHPETQPPRALDNAGMSEHLDPDVTPGEEYCVNGELTHMLVKKLYPKLDDLLKAQKGTLPYVYRNLRELKSMHTIISWFELNSNDVDRSWIGEVHDIACDMEDWVDLSVNDVEMLSAKKKTDVEMEDLWVRIILAKQEGSHERACHEALASNARANPVSPVSPRDKIVKTLDKYLQRRGLKVESKLKSIVRLGMPGSDKTEQALQYMKNVFADSYYQLDVELKICLLHLSIFPVGQLIEVERLVRLWMAEGFIDGHLTRTNGEKVRIANDYICKLVSRKLIMYGDGMNRTISIDPDIHNFIVCMSTEQMLITLVHSEQEGLDVSPSKGTVRRLSLLNNGKEDQAAAGTYGKHLRSVTVFNNTGGMPLLAETTRLRVLDLEGCKGPVCLDDLHKLLFLRYLGLRGTDVSELPAQIGELTCLETLDVRSTKVKEIPRSIIRLQKLMHLLAGNAKLPCGIGKMKMLFALSCPDVATNSMSIMQELSEIDNLTELELICESSQEVSGEKKEVAFRSDGFHRLGKLCVQFGYSSLTFDTGALPNVQVLVLKLDKGLPQGSTNVSGIEHLRSLKRVHVKYSRDDANAKLVLAAVVDANFKRQRSQWSLWKLMKSN